MKVILMAGGKGSRINGLFPDIPKPMIPIDGVPVLEREIKNLKEQGFTDIILTVSHMAEKIINHFGNGKKFGVSVEYFTEKTPLGNAGALFKLRDRLKEPFLLLNADAVFDIDFKRFVAFHKSHKGLVSLFVHPNSHPYDSGLIIADEEGRVKEWLTKEDKRPDLYQNRVNAGLHIIDPEVLDKIDIDIKEIGNGKKVDLDRDILKPLCKEGEVFCYESPEYVKDMGTPERYRAVCKDFERGIIQAKNLKNRQKAIFLDRDGTVNEYVGFLRNLNEFRLIPGVAEFIKKINASEYLVIVVTNQPVIARGEVTTEELRKIHNKMETLLGEEGAYIDGLYYCPHHPHSGFPGEVKELKTDCDCRKPKPGMLLKAAEDFNIDLSKSWMIGDSRNDILAGKAAGCKTALLGTQDEGQTVSLQSLDEWAKLYL